MMSSTTLNSNCSKWVIDRSYRKMTSISMWAKERPYKRSWQDDQLLRRFKLKQKLSSSLLFVMVTTWILECLQTLLIWGKILQTLMNIRFFIIIMVHLITHRNLK